jgi:MYXO-CTERM domain-containing protein
VGALDYSGALGPQIMGFIWEDTVFTAAGSPYTLLGDLVVTAGRRVTFEPGVQFRVAPNTDGMIGGLSTTRAELRFLKDALFTFPTDGPAVVFTPNSTSPTAGMWWGTRFEDTIGSVEWLRVEYPQFGFNVVGPRSPTFEDVEVRYGTTNGFLIQNVTSSTNFADILAATLIGTNFAGSSRGVEATSSIVRLRSSYATHWGFGYFANATTVSTTAASHTLTNNTFVAQSYGVYANRSSSSTSYAQSLSLQNNLIANSTTGAIYDQNVAVGSGYNSAFTLLYNGYHNLATITVASGTTNTGPVTTNPNIEDDDWAAFPRWWDGQAFRTSPVINVGSPTAPSGLTRDLFGRARVLSSRVDIGAIEHDFTANQEPRADAVARSIVAPTGERVTLDGSAAVDLDGTIATAFWTMSDGTVTAGQSVQHTFATRGNAEAYITIVDDDGAPDHARVLVNVNDRPFAEANGPYFADVSTATVEEPVAFRSDNSSDTETAAASLTYVWNFGDGTPPVTGRNPLHPYTTAGLFIATLTVTDAAGLSATDTAVVEISGGAADTQGPLLQHTEIADGRPAGTPITVNVTAQDQTGVQSVTLFYRTIGTIPADEIELTRGAGTNWSGVIPGTAITAPGIEYWFSATDTTGAGNTTRLPVSASTFFNFTVSGDFVPPVITHTEVGDGQAPGSPVTVTATITDTTGVGVANLYYGSLSGSYASVTMTNVAGNTWSAQVPAVIVNAPGVKYYIEAIDTSPTPNRAVLPAAAPTTFFDFTVSSGDTTPPLIALTPVADNRPAGTAVTVNASIVDASGTVASAAIYYRPAGSTGAYTQVAMTRGTGSSWSGVIPAAAVTTPGVQYYVTGTDPAGNVGTEPSGAPATPLSFTVVTADTTAPTIVHTPIANGQSPGVAVVIEATITDASPLQTVRVHYKRSTSSSAPPWPAVDMTLVSGNLYRAEIPDFAVNTPAMFYYIRAIDSAGNTALLPTTNTTTPYQFSVGTSDVTGPTLTVTPVAADRTAGAAITVTATATDTSGIGAVTLFYRTTGGGAYTSVVMASTGGSGYSGTIPAGAVVAPGVDYYVVATDAATVPNSTTSPATAPGTPSSFTVITPDVTAPTITITPVSPNRPAATEVTVSATITDATGVASARLFYRATGGTAFTQVSMTNTAGTTWSASIPAGAVTAPGVDYYVTATDSAAAANTATAPSTAPGTPSSFTVTPADTQAPVITHTLVTSVTYGEVIGLSTTITDNVGVTSAQAFISIDAINWTPYSLSRGLGDAWGTTFLTSLIPSGTPSVYYYLSADDAAGNRSFLPAAGILGPQVVTVNYPDVTPPTLSVDALSSPAQAGVAIPVTARATDASGVSNVTIYYRSNGIGSYNVLATAGAGPYTATIPAAAVVTGTLQVYAQATDTEGNVATSTTQTITVEPAPDLTAPTINLTAVPNGQAAGTAVTVTASITDDSGIASATLYHRLQGSSTFTTVPMTAAAGSTFTAVIPGIAVSAPAVEYYVRAVDGSASANAANVPAAAPTLVARFTVTVGDTAGPGIAHTPPPLPILAGTSVSLSATLTDSTGVASAEVYWRTGSAGAFTTVAMANVSGTWTASIGPVAAPEFTYYIRAVDTLGNASTDPTDAPTSTRQRTVTVPDTTGPIISHTPLAGDRTPGLSIAIEANVTDATGVSAVRVRYRTVGSTPFTSLDLANAGSGRYTGTIPGAAVVAPGFEYYLEATDTAAPSNLALLPSGAPATLYTVTTAVTAADLTPPTLTHTPIPGPLAAGVSLVVEASAADTSGIRDVTLCYRVVGDADWISAPMTLVGPTWRATIPARNIVSPGIEYYLTATDNAPAANRATLPASAPAVVYAVDVATPDTAGPTITVTRYTEPVPVGLDLPFTATVTDPSGVASVTLHWRQTGTATFAQLAMTPDGGDSFAATIPGSLVDEAGIEYWVSAVDASAAANTATAPASAPTTVYTVETFVAADTDAPVIVVTEVTSPQPADTDVAVVADVTDASDIVSVILYARAEAAADWAIVDMEPLEGDTFSAVIDATVVTEGTVYYYVLAEDAEGNVALEPLTAPTETFSFSVLPIEQVDTTPPNITHIPPAELVANADATIEALVADASGVNSVTVYYTSGSVTDAISVTAANESDDTWVAIIPASDVTGEFLSYYIVADDLAVAGNVGTLPSDAPASVFSVTLVQGGGDTGLDAGNDAGLDAGNDAGTDAGDTTSADVTPDAETDAGGDVTVDASSDSGTDSEPSGSGSGNSSGGGCSATATSRATPVTLGLMLAAMLLVHRRRRVCPE